MRLPKELFVNSTNVISKLFIGNINKDTENNIEKIISIEKSVKTSYNVLCLYRVLFK